MGSFQYVTTWGIATNGFPANQVAGNLTDLVNVTCADPLRSPGQFSATMLIKNQTMGNRVEQITVPDRCAIYVVWTGDDNPNNPIVVWGGLITGRAWDPQTCLLTITASQWESWFATREITPNAADNSLRDATFTFTNVDQFDIMRSLMTLAMSEQDCPVMVYDNPSSESGLVRTLAWQSSSFQNMAQAFTDLSQQSGGFDWKIDYRIQYNSAGLQSIVPYIHFYYPERQVLGAYNLRLAYQMLPSGLKQGNLITYTYPEDSTARMSRMWDTASGSTSDQLIRNAVAPFYGQGAYIYREANETLPQSITDTTLLDQHCRVTIRQAAAGITIMQVYVTDTNPSLDRYLVGDRTQLIINDRWVQLNYPAVRIIERDLSAPNAQNISVTLTLDITDNYGPSVEA